MESADPIAVLVVIGLMLVMYLVPTLIATTRKHHNFPAIIAVNILLGWTILGWVAALVWSLTSVQAQAPQVVVNTQSPPPQPIETIPALGLESAMRLETVITAKKGALTYRVLAYRQLTEEECKRVVVNALQTGEIEEPPPGGTATIVTDIA